MDEILSSIRQIIADDDDRDTGSSEADASEAPELEAFAADTEGDKAPEAEAQPAGDADQDQSAPAKKPSSVSEDLEELLAGISFDPESEKWPEGKPDAPDPEPEPALEAEAETPAASGEDEPLELSAAQIVSDDEVGEQDADPMEQATLEGAEVEPEIAPEAEPDLDAHLVEADDIGFDGEPVSDLPEVNEAEQPGQGQLDPGSAAAIADAAPMPDPELSSDMAEQLLDATSQAAVSHAFTKLGNLALGNSGITLEAMVREMLRPMLKEWLDENLPATVERIVEREIERISRGGR